MIELTQKEFEDAYLFDSLLDKYMALNFNDRNLSDFKFINLINSIITDENSMHFQSDMDYVISMKYMKISIINHLKEIFDNNEEYLNEYIQKMYMLGASKEIKKINEYSGLRYHTNMKKLSAEQNINLIRKIYDNNIDINKFCRKVPKIYDNNVDETYEIIMKVLDYDKWDLLLPFINYRRIRNAKNYRHALVESKYIRESIKRRKGLDFNPLKYSYTELRIEKYFPFIESLDQGNSDGVFLTKDLDVINMFNLDTRYYTDANKLLISINNIIYKLDEIIEDNKYILEITSSIEDNIDEELFEDVDDYYEIRFNNEVIKRNHSNGLELNSLGSITDKFNKFIKDENIMISISDNIELLTYTEIEIQYYDEEEDYEHEPKNYNLNEINEINKVNMELGGDMFDGLKRVLNIKTFNIKNDDHFIKIITKIKEYVILNNIEEILIDSKYKEYFEKDQHAKKLENMKSEIIFI